jgi:hypothetical protein
MTTPDLNVFRHFLLSVSRDSRITVWHLALVFGIIQLATDSDIKLPIYISRKQVMELSRVSSIATYHKCIKELQIFGYIDYNPSYHPGIKTYVKLLLRPIIKLK